MNHSTSCATGNKCRKVFESALGKILFIDEAYRYDCRLLARTACNELPFFKLVSVCIVM